MGIPGAGRSVGCWITDTLDLSLCSKELGVVAEVGVVSPMFLSLWGELVHKSHARSNFVVGVWVGMTDVYGTEA